MKQRPPFVVRVLGVVALVASAGLALYWFTQEAGFYRFLAEQQSKLLGGYDDKITVLLTWLILFAAMVFPLFLFYRFTQLSEAKVTTPGQVRSTEEEAEIRRSQRAEQQVLRLGTSFRKLRQFAVMGVLLLVGTGFGIFRLAQLLQGNLTDPVGLILAWICALIGAWMLRSHFTNKRKGD